MMQTLSSPEIVYSETKKRSNPTYQFQRIEPLEGTDFTVTAVQNSGNVTFRIPSHLIFNLSESYLTFSSTFRAGGDDGGGNDYYNYQFVTNVPWFSRVQMKTRDGLMLVDSQNNHYASEIMNRVVTRNTEFQTSNMEQGRLRRIRSDGVTSRSDGTDMITPYSEHIYVFNGDANTDTPVITYKLKLADLVQWSLLELGKDLYFGKDIEIILSLNSNDFCGFKGVDGDNPNTDTVALDDPIDLTALRLSLAVEMDESIIRDIMTAVESPQGLQILTPYPIVRDSVTDGSTNHTSEAKLFNSDGNRVLCVMSSGFFNAPATPNLTYNSVVQSGGTNYLNAYHVEVNDRRIQLDELNAQTTIDHFIYNLDHIRGSHIQNWETYDFNWYHCEDFSGYRGDNRKKLFEENVACGYPVDKEFKYKFVATGSDASNFLYYHIFVTQRLLTIKKNQVTLD